MAKVTAIVSTGKASKPSITVGDTSVCSPTSVSKVEVIASKFIMGHWFIAHTPINERSGIVVSHAQTGYLATGKGNSYSTTREAFDKVLYNLESFERKGIITFSEYIRK